MNTPDPDGLRSLLAAVDPDTLEVVLPGPDEALAVIRPTTPVAAADAVGQLRRGLVPWTIGPLAPGRRPCRPVVVLDVSRLSRVDPVQPQAGLVRVEAGVRTETLARLLRAEGFTADPLFSRLLVGRTLAGEQGRLSDPGSAGPCLADRVVALQAALPDGSLLTTPLAPRRATGPDLAALLLGSGGMLGVILAATLRVDRLPQRIATLGYVLPDEPAAQRALTCLQGAGLPLTGLLTEGVRLVVRLAGPAAIVQASRLAVERLLARFAAQAAEPDGSLLAARVPPPRPHSAEVEGLTAYLRRSLDPAGLLLTTDEACGREPAARAE